MLLRELNATAVFATLVLTSPMMLPSVDTLLPRYVNSSTFSSSSLLILTVSSPVFTFINWVFDVLMWRLTVPAVLANSSVSQC